MVPALLLLLLVGVIQGSPPQSVTCGSTLKLLNVHHKVRLHSHEVKYGSGSGQQSVTGNDHKEDVNSHWVIKGPTNKLEVSAFGDEGEGDTGDVWTVVCDGEYWSRDATVMFKHSDTSALLASSGQTFGRPISGQKKLWVL
ncbi:Stromal cell-derived factor 2,Stromal cell-derived factor 2-like protein 1 [Lepeophtheirus salmonis]|uniref:Stromal cell-derived factor 2,Stromal cell-derived factor 2-like protein 1 n=1 Tax=Lepeophtheirus salmonis TaxID=72036 RepID=A0A7R8CWH6_LEPSM|nr:Stromal cell-derived factor 2,Stromal cell-derived factor 2-like protein 1 [Lepeophtheirus salmonis]CAF2952448.1 Stromal cell-derived factor 2,Stromal cell-derived factor 2-like protein 1 [Lepeophtheirus salmonis]